MSTKAQLIESLKDYPDDANIEVVVTCKTSYDSYTMIADFDQDCHLDVLDFRGDGFKNTEYYGTVTIRLGTT